MRTLKRDYTKTFEQDLNEILSADQDELLYTFAVVPLDYGVQDWTTPTLYLTRKKIVFRMDDLFEVYELQKLEITLFGDIPKFTIWQQYFEGSYQYSQNDSESFNKIRSADHLTRFSFNEPGEISREFVLRDKTDVLKNYQNWAMAQIILNVKNEVQNDPILDEMLAGNFSRYNKKSVITFIAVFLGYFIIKLISLSGFPDLLDRIIDLLFGVVLVAMLVWSVKSINKNLDRYKATYNQYYSPVRSSVTNL